MWAMVGGLQGKDWRELGKNEKEKLMEEVQDR